MLVRLSSECERVQWSTAAAAAMRFENEDNRIYKILSRANRNFDVLHQLNSFLHSLDQQQQSSELDGFLLHYLTETAQATDEYSFNFSASNHQFEIKIH